MGIVFYSTNKSKVNNYYGEIGFRINRNKILKVDYESASYIDKLLRIGEVIYKIKPNIRILGFINYDFSKWENTTIEATNNHTIIYFQDCKFPQNMKLKNGMVILEQPKFTGGYYPVLEIEKGFDVSISVSDEEQTLELITSDIENKLKISGKMKSCYLHGSSYNIPVINELDLEDTKLSLGSVKSNLTNIKNSDVDLLFPRRTTFNNKIIMTNSRLKTRNQSMDLTIKSPENLKFEMENSLLEAKGEIKLPSGTYLLRTPKMYDEREYKSDSNDLIVYSDVLENRQDYIEKLKELRSQFSKDDKEKVMIKKK